MTAQRPTASRGPLLTVIAIVVLGLAGAGLWYLFFRPGRARPGGPRARRPRRRPPRRPRRPRRATTPATDAAARRPGSTAVAAGEGITGTWTIDPSVGSFSDFSGTFVGYRVQETLASIGAQKPSAGRRT